MQYLFISIIFTILSGWSVNASVNLNEKFAFGSIPSTLSKNANAVCREYKHEFHLKTIGTATERVRIVVTVLNEQGEDYGNLIIPYDRAMKFNFINVRSYNFLGVPDNKKKIPPVNDVNYTSGGAIYDDIRLKQVNFKSGIYPYTTEYEFEIFHNSLIAYPQWKPVKGYNYAVEKSSYIITWPEEMIIRFREMNFTSVNRIEKNTNGIRSFEWKLDSYEPIRPEPLSPGLNEHTPIVLTAPAQFMFEGSIGSMNTWNEFGKWAYELNKDRTNLPEFRKEEIRKLTGEITDTLQAVKKLFNYMQSRTRYVGVQLGLGGYQPFPAETVDRLGYGDCKALSNYMKAILQCVNIPSYYAIIGSGHNKGITMPDFPSIEQNNHVILCVPFSMDTLWLECTSQTIPCGYLGLGTAGKRALLITENGGVFAHTPKFSRDENSQVRVSEISISSDGSMTGKVNTIYSGFQFENVSDVVNKDYMDQQHAILQEFQITGLKINDISYKIANDRFPQIEETFIIDSELFSNRTGDRLFIPWNAFNRIRNVPPSAENRNFRVILNFDYYDKDSIKIVLPEGYSIERMPGNKTVLTDFGEYTISSELKNNSVFFIREFKINQGKWPKESYNLLVDFYRTVFNLDNQMMVLKRF